MTIIHSVQIIYSIFHFIEVEVLEKRKCDANYPAGFGQFGLRRLENESTGERKTCQV